MNPPSASRAPKRFLFVCIENSNRSQMAEAFAKIHGNEHIEAYSAGSVLQAESTRKPSNR